MGRFHGIGHKPCIFAFCFECQTTFNLACWSPTGQYRPMVVFVRMFMCLVRTTMTSSQYFAGRPQEVDAPNLIYLIEDS